jgi:hypothetical protein
MHPVPRELRAHVAPQFIVDHLASEHDPRYRTFLPFLVLNRDDRSLVGGRVQHEVILQFDRRDPLAAASDQVS